MTSTAVARRTYTSPRAVRAGHEMSFLRDPASTPGTLTRADAEWPRRLRRIVRATLHHWERRGLLEAGELIETEELLTTELVTNALRHGRGPEIRYRLYLTVTHLVTEVRDGSTEAPVLRHAPPTAESGRGLFLVDVMAESWGVSEDGTTTWCTLPLTKGPEEMQSVAVTAPVLREIPMDLPTDPSAAGLARIQARTLLTVLSWPGNQHFAIDVLHVLVDNAVQHALTAGRTGQTFGARLSITEAHELLVDVTDPVPEFPNFDKAVAGELGRGLWEIARQGAALSWFVVGSEFDAKTVRAILRPGVVEP
ncbi:ATP-binding protein [Streptomyces echinoruber]|nr:ATP-binding protein [Streptomyces echinoruber]